MTQPRDRSAPRLTGDRGILVAALAGLVALVVVLALGSTSIRHGGNTNGAAPADAAASAPASSPPGLVPPDRSDAFRLSLVEPQQPWQEGDYQPDLAAVQALLDRRGAAAVDGDVEAYVDTGLVDATARPQAEAIAKLPIGAWRYTMAGPSGPSPVLDAQTVVARTTYGPDSYVLRVDLTYRIDGYDRTDVTSEHAVTVAYQGGGWKIIDDVPSDDSKELWDFGGLRTYEGASTLVVGLGPNPPARSTLAAYAAAADVGVKDVTTVWGRQWQRRALIVAAPTVGDMASALGRRSADYTQIAAVTTANHPNAAISRGDRVFVNPRTFGKLGPRGRTVVLRHEITHVATLAAADDAMPTWMEEGFADYVGYRGSGVPGATIVRELSTWVAAGARPRSLPSDDDYNGRNPHLVEAYEQSWLATHLVAEEYGRPALVNLYREMQKDTSANPRTGVDDAFRAALGLSFAEFTREWRAAVRSLG